MDRRVSLNVFRNATAADSCADNTELKSPSASECTLALSAMSPRTCSIDTQLDRGLFNQRFMNHLFSVVFFLAMLMSVFGSASISAAVMVEAKPQSVVFGESFNLIITSDEEKTSIPNLKPLQKDFRIVGTERTMSYTVMDGQARSTHQFIVLLVPQKTGKLTIPALSVGNQKTKPIVIDVADKQSVPKQNTSPASSADDAIMLKTDVSVKKPFVSEEVILTVRLYNSGRLMDAEYQPPKVENALLLSLGDADRYQTSENGRNYVVEEQHYAIFPQKSGQVKITGPAFQGLVYDAVPRQVTIPSKTIELDVKPAPKDFPGSQWLPAKKITLSQHFNESLSDVEQGETVIRTIEIQAQGIPAQLLPVLEFKNHPAYNVYPEKAEIKNTVQQYQLVGQSTRNVVYLMNEAGRVTLPEIKLTWYNTQTGKTEIATLPPRTVKVKPSPGGRPDKPQEPKAHKQVSTAKVAEAGGSKDASQSILYSKSSPIPWILAAGFAVAWVLTLLVLWYRPYMVKGSKRRRAIKQLHEACIKNNPIKAREALLNWASIRWPDETFLDLNDIARQVPDTKFKKQLNILSKAIYSPSEKRQWDGNALWLGIASYRKKKPSDNGKPGDLPPINP